ncbi:hypothetical protein HS961_15220 [Comamonas piscis]|uniref:CdiI C-terminal domain-containing protein n=1 Tax=Comamonas piscis TaxID=1562974 RepID=A0A7G5EJA3_9BURK|nr:hypothetical protein [Comamonas piscis]QMV74078.1 hypothetical protein HS961_15220 [Comamonas piscis]WSO32514.1 hypothetical protein VUJ63_15260 [Comamonas piscis]
MTFNIKISKDTKCENGFHYEIDIGAHREVVPIMTTRWSPEAYKRQWVEALEFLVASRSSRCALITCIQPESVSYGITYWALFREGDFVYFQERFIRYGYRRFLISPMTVDRYMPDRMEGTFEEYSQISEWVLPISDIQKFLLSINDGYFQKHHL